MTKSSFPAGIYKRFLPCNRAVKKLRAGCERVLKKLLRLFHGEHFAYKANFPCKLHHLEKEELEVIGLRHIPEDRVVRGLLADLNLPQFPAGVVGGAV